VRRWNGSNWEEVGPGSAIGGGISDSDDDTWCPSLAIALDGTPYIAWHEWTRPYTFPLEVYVRRWNGSNWEEVGAGSASGGGISDNSGESYAPSVAIAPDGTPYVAWYDSSGGDDEIYVRRWGEPTPLPRTVTGQVTDGHRHSLPGVFVSLLKDMDTSYAMTTTTDSNGNYIFSDVPSANTYKIRVILRDGSGRTRIHWGQYGLLVSANTQPFNFATDQTSTTVNIDFSDTSLDSTPIPVHDLDDLAVMFYHSQQVSDFVRSTLGESEFQPTESVWGFSPKAGVFYHYGPEGSEVNIGVSSSQWNDPNCPMNREWHENFHHVMHDILTIPPYHPCQSGSCETGDCVNGNCNHRGYTNHCTVDSWVEGWAEFWPCVLWDTLGYPGPHLYRAHNTWTDFEYNWRAWEYQGSLSREEFAVASLLWDLYDPLDSADNDYIDLTASQIWSVIGNKTHNDLSDIKDVYDTFVAAGMSGGDSDGDGLSDLDELFVAHGIFADTDGNHSHGSQGTETRREDGRCSIPRSVASTACCRAAQAECGSCPARL